MRHSSVVLFNPNRIHDARGWFSETYNERRVSAWGITERFVQDNHSLSHHVGTVRGLHFQRPPHTQAKLVRCLRGKIFDVVIDLRRGSPTYGRSLSIELSGGEGQMLFVPSGFAHGFMTLEPDTEVTYKVSDFYAPDCDAGLAWNDESLAISWPNVGTAPIVSVRDHALPGFEGFDSPFNYDGAPFPTELAHLTVVG